MADAVKIKAVIEDRESEFPLQPLFQRAEPVFLDLIHRSALYADQMVVMMLAAVGPEVITGYPVSEIQLLHHMQLT